jgi:uncharacterized SAM-binding protein YcdF (DUF218 family)
MLLYKIEYLFPAIVGINYLISPIAPYKIFKLRSMILPISISIIFIAIITTWSTLNAAPQYTSIKRSGRALRPLSINKNNGGSSLIVVLGSDNNKLLEDRMDVALNSIQGIEGDVIWYLTGGVKRYNDKGAEKITEASKMLHILKKEGNTNAIVVDDKAQNTAENFVKLKEWLDHINQDINIHIVTSAFHFIRAKSMFEKILPNIQATWDLGYVSCATCVSDENIHRSHIIKDVEQALEKEKLLQSNSFKFRRGHSLDTIDEYDHADVNEDITFH